MTNIHPFIMQRKSYRFFASKGNVYLFPLFCYSDKDTSLHSIWKNLTQFKHSNVYLPSMNFLAHIYLSGQNEKLIIGNFIADSVKGKKYLDYPEGIKNGIILHRAIDYYTDTHPVVRKSRSRLFDIYGHYSGVIVDILYDHFLAANWEKYSDVPLDLFVSGFYDLLQKNLSILPKNVQQFLPYMIKDNWLLSYATIKGIGRILHQMNERTNRVSQMNNAVVELEGHYDDFLHEFTLFFEELKMFSQQKITTLR